MPQHAALLTDLELAAPNAKGGRGRRCTLGRAAAALQAARLVQGVQALLALPHKFGPPGARRLLVALDFDGTLAPEVDDPLAARALPEATAALEALRALPETVVALVAGRSLDSLAHVGQVPPETPLVGSHGLEVRLGAGTPEPAVDDVDRERVDALRAALSPLVDAVEGAYEINRDLMAVRSDHFFIFFDPSHATLAQVLKFE